MDNIVWITGKRMGNHGILSKMHKDKNTNEQRKKISLVMGIRTYLLSCLTSLNCPVCFQ